MNLNLHYRYGGNRHALYKFLLVMKLIVILITTAIMQVSASSFAQKITLNRNSAPLSQIINEIRIQSGYDFFYNKTLLKSAKPVTIKVENASIEEVLEICFKNQPLEFQIEEKTVMIKEKEKSVLEKIVDRFQDINVTGKVTDESGSPLAGANINVKGTTQSTTTSSDGKFFLRGVSEEAILVITYIGYEPREIKASSNVDVVLKLKFSELDEVTVSTGYFSTTKAKSTMNITKVDAKDIEKQPVTSLLLALQGRVAGLEVIPVNGVPGSAIKVQIRGNNSLRFDGSYPLYVIDGVPISSEPIRSEGRTIIGNGGTTGFDPLSTINANNIEKIEILKDGAATAIYGTRGANGVILITTKQAKNTAKTSVDFSASTGGGQMTNRIQLLNTEQYLAMRKEAFSNRGVSPASTDYDLVKWDNARYTDWQDVLLGGTANVHDVQAGITGGNENTNFRFNGAYHKENVIYSKDFGYRNISGSFSLNHKSTDQKFAVNLTLNYGSIKNKLFSSYSFVSNALTLPPNAPALYTEDGALNWEFVSNAGTLRNTWENPLNELLNTHEVDGNNLIANSSLSYKFFQGFVAKVNVGYSSYQGSELLKRPIAANIPGTFPIASATFGNNDRRTIISEPQIEYQRRWQKHSISMVGGANFQMGTQKYFSLIAEGYQSDALLGSTLGAPSKTVLYDEANTYKYISTFIRLGYDFNDRFQLDLVGRRDGSSRFGPGKQFGNFGALGMGWIFANSDVNANKLLSFGKIRTSYGITGNDQIGDYNFYNTYSINNSQFQSGVTLYPTSLFNPEYGWETTKKLEASLILGFLKNRINTEITWYRNRSSNQLVSYPLPATTGFTSILRNFDALIENSGWEFVLTSKVISRRNFEWSTSVNMSIPQNKLVRFDGIENSPYANIYKVGEPLSVQQIWTWTGVDPQTGIHTFLDVNNDQNIDEADWVFDNTRRRKFYGGMHNSFQYKNFELSFLFQFVNQKVPKLFASLPGSRQNQPIDILNRWKQTGDITDVQKFWSRASSPEGRAYSTYLSSSSYNVQDGSFARLKTLSASYRLPKALFNTINSTVFIQGQNLFTLSKYKGLDPETGSGTLPPLKMLTVGLQVKL